MPEGLYYEMEPRVTSLAAARRALRLWLAESGVDHTDAEDLVSVASEFLLHGVAKAAAGGVAVLRADLGDEGVMISVDVASTSAMPTVRPLHRLPAEPLARGGLGWRIVDTVCDRVVIDTKADRLTMRGWRRG